MEFDAGETFGRRKGAPRIDENDLIPGGGGDGSQRLGDMHAADDDQAQGRAPEFDKEFSPRRLRQTFEAARPRGEEGAPARLVEIEPIKGSAVVQDPFAAVEIDRRRGFFAPVEVSNDGLESGWIGDLLDKNLDRAAAGQADRPGLAVADAEFQQCGLAGLHHFGRIGQNFAFDAAARDRADEMAELIHGEARSGGARRRAPGGDDRRQRSLPPAPGPRQDLAKDAAVVVHRVSEISGIKVAPRRLRSQCVRAGPFLREPIQAAARPKSFPIHAHSAAAMRTYQPRFGAGAPSAGGATMAEKLAKNSSASFFAALSIIRPPSWAILPPTSASTS